MGTCARIRLRQRRYSICVIYDIILLYTAVNHIIIIIIITVGRGELIWAEVVAGKTWNIAFFSRRFKWVRFSMHHKFGVLYCMNKKKKNSTANRKGRAKYLPIRYDEPSLSVCVCEKKFFDFHSENTFRRLFQMLDFDIVFFAQNYYEL